MSATELVEDGMLGVSQARQFSGLSRTFLYDLMTTGKLAYTKVGTRRLIPKKALIKVLAEGLSAQAEQINAD